MSELETEENTEGSGLEAGATQEQAPEGAEPKKSMNREVIENIPITLSIEVGRHTNQNTLVFAVHEHNPLSRTHGV